MAIKWSLAYLPYLRAVGVNENGMALEAQVLGNLYYNNNNQTREAIPWYEKERDFAGNQHQLWTHALLNLGECWEAEGRKHTGAEAQRMLRKAAASYQELSDYHPTEGELYQLEIGYQKSARERLKNLKH